MELTLPIAYLGEYLTATEYYFLTNQTFNAKTIQICEVSISTETVWGYCVTVELDVQKVFQMCVRHAGWDLYTAKYALATHKYMAHRRYSKIITALIKARRPLSFVAYSLARIPISAFSLYLPAVRANHLLMLKWLQQDSSDTMVACDSICTEAAEYGQLNILRWLRNPYTGKGRFHWCFTTCTNAAFLGHLKCLKWLRNPRTGGGVCPWDKDTCMDAVLFDNEAIKEWVAMQPNVEGDIF